MNNKSPLTQFILEMIKKAIQEETKKGTLKWEFPKGATTPWKDINKIEKKNTLLPKDQPDQAKAKKESSTFGSDSFQGGAFGLGGKSQLTAPVRHVPEEEIDTDTMQLPSSRDREKLGSKKQ